jgi:hypothetical protein
VSQTKLEPSAAQIQTGAVRRMSLSSDNLCDTGQQKAFFDILVIEDIVS